MIEDGLQKNLMWSSVLHKSSLSRCSVKLRCNQRRWTRWCAIGAALDSGYSSEFDRGAVQMVGSWCGSAGSSCHNKEVIRVDLRLTIPTGGGHFVWWSSSEDYFKQYSRCFLILVQIQWSSWSLMHIFPLEQDSLTTMTEIKLKRAVSKQAVDNCRGCLDAQQKLQRGGGIFCKFQKYFIRCKLLFSFVDHIYCALCKDDATGGGRTAHLDNVNESAPSPTITALFKC